VVTSQFTTVTKFKDTLTDFERGSVNLVEEKDYTLGACSLEPSGRTPFCNVVVGLLRQSKQVTLSHLRGSTVYDREIDVLSKLEHNLRFTDTVPTTE
jgi:hypothetical protein